MLTLTFSIPQTQLRGHRPWQQALAPDFTQLQGVLGGQKKVDGFLGSSSCWGQGVWRGTLSFKDCVHGEEFWHSGVVCALVTGCMHVHGCVFVHARGCGYMWVQKP